MRFLEALHAARALPDDFVSIARPKGPAFQLDDLGQLFGAMDRCYLGDILDMDDWTVAGLEGEPLLNAIARREGWINEPPRHDCAWNDPAARGALASMIGTDAYNAAVLQHRRRQTIASVGGHCIRPVASRFGRLFEVGDTEMAFDSLASARSYAMHPGEPRGEACGG